MAQAPTVALAERRREMRLHCIDAKTTTIAFFVLRADDNLPTFIAITTDARSFVGLNHDRLDLQRRAPGTSRARGAELAHPRTVSTSSIGSMEPIYGAALDVMDVRLQCALHRLGREA